MQQRRAFFKAQGPFSRLISRGEAVFRPILFFPVSVAASLAVFGGTAVGLEGPGWAVLALPIGILLAASCSRFRQSPYRSALLLALGVGCGFSVVGLVDGAYLGLATRWAGAFAFAAGVHMAWQAVRDPDWR